MSLEKYPSWVWEFEINLDYIAGTRLKIKTNPNKRVETHMYIHSIFDKDDKEQMELLDDHVHIEKLGVRK